LSTFSAQCFDLLKRICKCVSILGCLQNSVLWWVKTRTINFYDTWYKQSSHSLEQPSYQTPYFYSRRTKIKSLSAIRLSLMFSSDRL
jgi:hypothetical protein